VYGANHTRFLNILKYVKVLQAKGTEETICSFEGFCGLFCNSQQPCPSKKDACAHVESVLYCYMSFANQSEEDIPLATKSDIWAKFSGIDMKTVGQSYKLPTKNILKTVDKKTQKRIKKLIKKTKSGMRAGANLYRSTMVIKKRKKKKPIVTTLFCNDDEEWRKKIDSYLESDETDNRQSTKNA